MKIEITDETLYGTYAVRDLGRDKGVHIPSDCNTPRFDIHRANDGVIVLVPAKGRRA
jgi:hypothetical protein